MTADNSVYRTDTYEREQAMLKLESKAYYMGHRTVFEYTDDFEDL